MITYKFLVFSLLFLFPGLLIYIFRTDLRPVIRAMSILAIPFAFTERLFYPTYWEPVFLFDLVNLIGFGIEDIIFVIGLASFSSTAYALVAGKSYLSLLRTNLRETVFRAVSFLIVVFLLVGLLFWLNVEMIYGSVGIMVVSFFFISVQRRDLFIPGGIGACLTLVIYSLLCLLIGRIFPDIFKLTWHAERFLNIFIFGIPVEEMMYAGSTGLIATVFYPYLMKKRFVSFKKPGPDSI